MLFNRQITVIFAKIVCSHILDIIAEACERKIWIFLSHHFSKQKTRKVTSEGSPFTDQKLRWSLLKYIWGQSAASSAWVHCLLGHLKEKLADTMEQGERLAWREINGRGAHGRWLRRIYPDRILCIKLVSLFYTQPDWWCTVLSGQEGEQATPLWSYKRPSSRQICVSLSKKAIHAR